MSLSDLLPSAAAVLGVPGFSDTIGLPSARRVCVLLIDGLGWNLLNRFAEHAPFLMSLARRPPGTAGFPSTTATSVTSICTGLPPGLHGILGYRVRVPQTGELMNSLTWDVDVDPLQWQPHPTVFERVAVHGTTVFQVAPGSFQHSGLTRAASRGARYVPAETAGDLVAGVARSAGQHSEALIYSYFGDLDRTGHLRGCGSAAWRHQLTIIDRLVERLVEVLAEDTVLVVTGDHGMVDTPTGARVDIDAEPALRQGVALVGGEPRMRYVYAEPGAEGEVLEAWRSVLGERAWVVPRSDAVAAGWFGPVREAVLGRIGDVICAARGDTSVVRSIAEPEALSMVGHHGSLTADEQLVPFLVASGRGRQVG
jgi:hypothetical protein